MITITVLLPVYNGERYLRDTIESILTQTYRDFELLIVDDGSTDTSLDIIKSFTDDRIRVLKNPKRLKLSGALNRGIDAASGKYIARMDADDIALPERLQKQFMYMEEHPEVGMCGTGIEIFGNVRTHKDVYPKNTDAIRAYALFDCPFCHPTVMLRKDLFVKHELWYDGEFYPTEDYELWTRAIELFPTANLEDVLLRYRVHGNSMTGADWDAMDKQAVRIIGRLFRKFEVEWDSGVLALHRNIGRGRSCQCSVDDIIQADNWLTKLFMFNESHKQFEQQSFIDMLALVWFRLCMNNSSLGIQILSRYKKGNMAGKDSQILKRSIILFLSIIKNKMSPAKVV